MDTTPFTTSLPDAFHGLDGSVVNGLDIHNCIYGSGSSENGVLCVSNKVVLVVVLLLHQKFNQT